MADFFRVVGIFFVINCNQVLSNFLVLLYWHFNPVWVLSSSMIISIVSCPAPLFLILLHQGIRDLSVHYPAILHWIFSHPCAFGHERNQFPAQSCLVCFEKVYLLLIWGRGGQNFSLPEVTFGYIYNMCKTVK